ncbi:acid-sensing ion channel 5-like [Patella vulgata]|uniref:acid-sensing ion channel 5-like n=1 Tax=Patella vulgata TaxID=6465 RepID=UPI0021804BDA|nr:acid-sensing ion channel 5-like [Patella vulgata]
MIKIITDFLHNTSLHGCKNIPEQSRSKINRIIWMLVVLTFVCILWVSVVGLYQEVVKYKTLSTTKFEHRSFLEFPSITICTQPYDTSKLNLSQAREFEEFMVEKGVWNTLKNPKATNLSDVNITLATSLSPPFDIKDVFLEITWNLKRLDPSSYLQPVSTRDPECVGFNTKGTNETFISSSIGIYTGLRILANIHQDRVLAGPIPSSSIEVFIHTPSTSFYRLNKGILVAPGTSTSITMNTHEYTFLPYPHKITEDEYCIDTSLDKNKDYNRLSCRVSWVEDRVKEICNCTFGDTTSECDVQKVITCFNPQFSDYFTKSENSSLTKCPRPCRFVIYDTKTSFSYFPSDSMSRYLVRNGIIDSVDYARQNLLELYINFEDMVVWKTESIAEYNTMSILGSLGGHMGLFVGASMITVVELLETLVFFFIAFAVRMGRPRIVEPAILTKTSMSKKDENLS